MPANNKIPLYGFNSLTKSLSFSLYRVHYLPVDKPDNKHENQTSILRLADYNTYINKTYSSERLTQLLTKVCHAIGGNVLNIASQDYTPQGASATLMISEEAEPSSLVAHLDKSHLCIHTYPEEAPQNGIAIFRADIELSTCGVISPLKVLDYVIAAFSADVIDIDYRVRGMTRDQQGKKRFCDANITNISEYLAKSTLAQYRVNNSVMTTHNLFHCKLARQSIELSQHVFSADNRLADDTITALDKVIVTAQLKAEIAELYQGK